MNEEVVIYYCHKCNWSYSTKWGLCGGCGGELSYGCYRKLKDGSLRRVKVKKQETQDSTYTQDFDEFSDADPGL